MSQINSSLPSIDRLVEAFQRLPGIGPKSAQRLTYHLIKMKREESEELASAALGIKDNLTTCEICFNISEKSQCSICSDDKRNNHIICVVEEPLNVLAIESARIFKGLYHVLYGVISPVDAIGPDNSQSIIRKIVLDSPPGNMVNDFHSLPYDYVSVQPSQIRNLHFRIADYRGRTVDMLHAGLSFSLLFVP